MVQGLGKNLFIALQLARKRLKKLKFWTRMIVDLYPKLAKMAKPILDENEEIIRILAKIIINTSSKN